MGQYGLQQLGLTLNKVELLKMDLNALIEYIKINLESFDIRQMAYILKGLATIFHL